MTLHEAITELLKQSTEGLNSTDIAETINKNGTYCRADGRKLKPSQISARVRRYSTLFEIKDKNIHLK